MGIETNSGNSLKMSLSDTF